MFVCSVGLVFVLADSGLQSRAENALLLGRSEGATTLTGRLPLWAALWEKSEGRRWLGFGYGAFWTVDRMRELNKDLGWYPGHSHSAYLHTMLDIGLVGAALMLSLAGAGVWQARRLVHRTGEPAYKFVLGLLAAGFVDGLVVVSFVYPRGLGLLLAMALFVLMTRHPALATAKSSSLDRVPRREAAPLVRSQWKGATSG
jgi:O-antigen ligase